MTGTKLMTKRVLAIDDDETILTVMDNVLKMHDYEAATATQWVEALDAINERTPDLLLLDLQMPHVDGFFLLEWIREQELALPVIVVSAYLDDDSLERLNDLGVSAFVWKPFNVGDLVEQIETLIGKPAPRATLDPNSQPVPPEGAESPLDKVIARTPLDATGIEEPAHVGEDDEANEAPRYRRRRRRSR